jgi:Putative esterase
MSRFAGAAGILLIALGLAACGGGGGSSSSSSPTPPVTGRTVLQTIDSAATGEQYPLTIYLPAGYDQGEKRYPIIYLTDAEYRYAPDLAVLQSSGVEAILVGIGDISDARRQVDFLMPGALAYCKFLTTELIPFVEGQFRVDPAQRTLSGHSSGGLVTMYAFLMEPPADRHYAAFMAEDASFWQQPDQLDAMEDALYAQHVAEPVTLFMSGDSSGGNYVSVAPFYCRLKARAYAGLDLYGFQYFVGHVPSDPPAFGDALNILFGLDKPAAGIPIAC